MHLSARGDIRLFLVLLALCCAPTLAHAVPAITCHCFTDRSFDPAHPTKADPYFLATTQNSFFASVYGIDKKTVVIQKQKGVSGDDLWVAYALAARTGANPDALLQERKSKGAWQRVAAAQKPSEQALGSRLASGLKKNLPEQRLSEAVVDEMLLRFRFYSEAELGGVRKAGAGNQEAILAGFLALRTGGSAQQLYREVKGGRSSWGALLQRAKIEPHAIEPEIAQRIRTGAAR